MAIKIGNKEIVDGDNHATFNNIITGKQDSGYAIRVGNKGFQGTVSGYTSGGFYPQPSGAQNTIDKFPFSSDANATPVGILTSLRYGPAGQSSATHGYTSGGAIPPTIYGTIDKFPFASDADASGVGSLTQERYYNTGQSSSEFGYTSGGFAPPYVTTIDKFSFVSDADAEGVGDLTLARNWAAGQSSSENGYTSSGTMPPWSTNTYYDIIEKFPFAVDSDATALVGELPQARASMAGQSSKTHGYTSGGLIGPGVQQSSSIIDKFPFASDVNATSVGNLTVGRYASTGQSSDISGYTSSGYHSPNTYSNVIDKFPFFSDADASGVGILTQARSSAAGQQV